ncbi:hypothetical protein D932_03510 [Enterococcus casseliflavus 14-MB-W-14]|nr:hypothetical protein D932_03510 [Enterococcus casseliflavus 14-MB-W-14]
MAQAGFLLLLCYHISADLTKIRPFFCKKRSRKREKDDLYW